MTLISKKFFFLLIVATAASLSGCATDPSALNLPSPSPSPSAHGKSTVVILEQTPKTRFEKLGPVAIRVKQLSVFHPNPTKDQAIAALVEKAREIGADAVINVDYKSVAGLTSCGHIDAQGIAVKFVH